MSMGFRIFMASEAETWPLSSWLWKYARPKRYVLSTPEGKSMENMENMESGSDLNSPQEKVHQ